MVLWRIEDSNLFFVFYSVVICNRLNSLKDICQRKTYITVLIYLFMNANQTGSFHIKPAEKKDIPIILNFIRKLATYEKLEHQVQATETLLEKNLFGDRHAAECLIGYADSRPVAFVIFFHNFSTFLAKPGIYIEDLYILPKMRGNGFGKQIFRYLARLAKERDCGRIEWWVLDWNSSAINFYRKIGAVPMDDWTVYRLKGNSLENLARKKKIGLKKEVNEA